MATASTISTWATTCATGPRSGRRCCGSLRWRQPSGAGPLAIRLPVCRTGAGGLASGRGGPAGGQAREPAGRPAAPRAGARSCDGPRDWRRWDGTVPSGSIRPGSAGGCPGALTRQPPAQPADNGGARRPFRTGAGCRAGRLPSPDRRPRPGPASGACGAQPREVIGDVLHPDGKDAGPQGMSSPSVVNLDDMNSPTALRATLPRVTPASSCASISAASLSRLPAIGQPLGRIHRPVEEVTSSTSRPPAAALRQQSAATWVARGARKRSASRTSRGCG